MGERGFLTMKWSNRIAQGFSPEWGYTPKIALKVATECVVLNQDWML